MDKYGHEVYLGLDISTTTIGVCILADDGSKYGKILELTHITPKVSSKIKGIEQLFLKKKIFEEFMSKYKDIGIDHVVIESPLLQSNNVYTVSTLLRFSGIISDSVYNTIGVVPDYISSYEARKFSFPELVSVRKFGKNELQHSFNDLLKDIKKSKFVLFGSYPWSIDKKTVIQEKVAENFPDVEWLYNKKGELLKQNFDACDAYVCVLAFINLKKYGDLTFNVKNIKITNKTDDESGEETPYSIDYDVEYWGQTEHRTTYVK